MKLKDRVAIITGGGGGIGRAVSEQFAQEGARVVIADVNEQAGRETQRILGLAKDRVLTVPCDVSKPQGVVGLMNTTLEAFGQIDVLFNCTALPHPQPPIPEDVAALSDDRWAATLEVNLSGYFHCIKYALPAMLKQKRGVILNVSSVMGMQADPNRPAYAATKAAIISLTLSVAAKYGPAGIRANALCPGIIITPRTQVQGLDFDALGKRTPLGRVGTPEDVAKLALFLASDDSSFITGAAIPIDGGFLLGPVAAPLGKT